MQDNPTDGRQAASPQIMVCPSCGAENAALSQRCLNCGEAFARPDDNRTMENADPKALRGNDPKPGSGSSRPNPGAGGGGGGSVRPQSENWKDSQVLSKTPSGIGRNDFFSKEDVNAGTLYGGDDPSPAFSPSMSHSRGGTTGANFNVTGGLESGMDFGPRFRIEQLLGEGGMGKVYRAYDKELGRTVALKILQPELTKDPSVILRFKQELLLASKISHRNILRIHDLSEFDGVKFITMAFIEGKDLNQLLKEDRPFAFDRAMKIGRQLCEALDAAHAEGVVHRDFKPHNVLMGQNDQVYVSDFGLATSLETAKMGMTRTGAFVGTPRYMSPEQVEGKTVDNRSDLYSLGLVLYEMVTGEVPFSGDSTWQVMYQRVKEAPKDVKLANPKVPDNVARIIMHCLEKEAKDRYQTAREIITDIDAGRSPEMSTTSMYRGGGNSPSSASRTVQITFPSTYGRWVYVAAGVLAFATLFLAIPQTRHLIFKPDTDSGAGSFETVKGLPPISQGKYLAVLPFRVLGDSASLGYVAEGLGEALSAKLFQLEGVHVTSSSDSTEDDSKATIQQLAKKLGANIIVHGFVQGNADQLRITVKLENVAAHKLLWSDEFSGVPGDLLTIEDKIFGKISDALEAKATGEVSASAHPTDNADAYDLYLRGKNSLRGQLDPKSIQGAIDYFNQALKKDPNFALAYTGLADASLRMYTEKKEPFWSDKALSAAKRAQQLNDKLPEVHFSQGSVYNATGQNSQAITEFKRALELAPNSDEAYRRLGRVYQDIGQKDMAIETLQKAVEINPYFWLNLDDLGSAYFSFGEYDRALKEFQKVIDLEPENAAGYTNVGSVYTRQGKYQESIAPLQKALQLQPDANSYSNLGTSLFYLKRFPEALQNFEKGVELNPSDQTYMGNLADAYRAAGQKDRANATYDKAIALCVKDLQVNPRDAATLGQMALYFAKKGEPDRGREFLQHAHNIDPSAVYLYYIGAIVEICANKPNEAMAELKKAMQKGQSAADVEADPEFAPLRARPDYQALIKQYAEKK